MATLLIPIAACTDETGNGGNGGGNGTVVSVVSMGNKGLEGVTVTATNGGKSVSGKTDENGNASLAIDKSLTYQVTFTDLPKGYFAEEGKTYSIPANSTEAVKFYLPSRVIKGESVDPNHIYKTGDVMYDFSFKTTVGSKVVTLSEELETKKAVLINFWGSMCSNCQSEFPMIEKTYKTFEEDLCVMALDPPQAYGDDDATIVRTLSNWGLKLSFYYGIDSANIYKNVYGPTGSVLPITLIIDRYAVICEIIVGAVTDEEQWVDGIAKYLADDYVPEPPTNQGAGDVENFEPDKPADFNAQMSDPADIDRAINKTGTDILFYADDGEYSWPWVLSSDGDSIVPLGSGHGLSYSIIYASINIPENKALLVDYKVSSYEYYDRFEIVVDYNDLGRVSFEDSGKKDWNTALAYVPLSAGKHEIAFVYYKGTQDKGKYEDTVYLKNLRFVDITSESIPSSDISYFAARDYSRNTYMTYEEVYFDNTDGYYHVKGRQSGGKDPYLLLDMTHTVPYTRSASLYTQYIDAKNTTFGTKNYYNELMSYAYIAGNSKIAGAVPVTKELHDILVALCRHEYGNIFDENPNMWLEFCLFYMHFGKGEAMDDPAKGLAYFSAYEVKETDVYDSVMMQTLADEINAAIAEKAKLLQANANADTSALDAAIAQKTDKYETYLAKFNSIDFDDIFVPRGKIVKFTAKEAGVYHFYSVGREDNPEYICEAQLYDGNLNKHTALADHVASHDSDTLFRDGSPKQFHLYHYLKAGESCYVNMMFDSTETIDTMYYAINKISDTTYKSLKTVTMGFLTTSLDPATLGKLYRPLYTQVTLNTSDNHYYASNGSKIFVDFTGVTRSSTSHTLKQVIDAVASGHPLKSGTVDVNFDFRGLSVKVGNETIVGQDYTQVMYNYLTESTANPESPEYGLVEANKQLRDIMTLFIYKYDELIVENEWLTFCYFYEFFGPNT